MGNCISNQSDEIRRLREASRNEKKNEWEKRYRRFSEKVKELYTPKEIRDAIWRNSEARTVTVYNRLRGFKKREEYEDFMDVFNQREKKPRLYKKYVGNKYSEKRVIIYYYI